MDTDHLIALGVIAQLALHCAHYFVRSPQQEARLDAIEAKVDTVVALIAPASAPGAALTHGKETAP